jgi:Flp pilus assembly pilin Flp
MIETLILASFSFFNTVRVFSYLPQMARIARDTNGATAVSYLTWSLWLCANGSTAAYAGVIIGDVALCLISSVNTLCCAIVIGLTSYKRSRWRAELPQSQIWNAAAVCTTRGSAKSPRRLPFQSPPPG